MVEVPAANAIWNGDRVRRFSTVDISVAVATDGGLVTPGAAGSRAGVTDRLSATAPNLADRARPGGCAA